MAFALALLGDAPTSILPHYQRTTMSPLNKTPAIRLLDVFESKGIAQDPALLILFLELDQKQDRLLANFHSLPIDIATIQEKFTQLTVDIETLISKPVMKRPSPKMLPILRRQAHLVIQINDMIRRLAGPESIIDENIKQLRVVLRTQSPPYTGSEEYLRFALMEFGDRIRREWRENLQEFKREQKWKAERKAERDAEYLLELSYGSEGHNNPLPCQRKRGGSDAWRLEVKQVKRQRLMM